jgi:hypothetical protein
MDFFRDGTFRLPGTQDPITLGVVLALSTTLCIWSYQSAGRTRLAMHGILVAALVYGVVGSGSRGGLLTLIIACTVLLLYGKTLGKVQKFAIVSAIAAGVIGFLFFNLSDYLLGLDEYGTFQYRLDVIAVGYQAFLYAPFFGSPAYHPIMEQVRNHDGIIDILNAYVEVPLHYGLPGLVLFATPAIVATRYLLKGRALMEAQGDELSELTYRVFAAALISFIIAIGTVGLVGFLLQYYWMLVGFAAASTSILRDRAKSINAATA